MAAIDIDGLEKRFGSTVALDGVDLRVRTGEVHGFLGPNGAGKSTTIRILLGLLRWNAGHVTVLGADPWQDAVAIHRRLAYVPGDVHLWPTLTGGEAIDLLGELRGGLDRARRDELIERFQLDPTKRCSTYSKGNRQKVAIVAGFASDVELFLLDEPTSGLDPLMEAVFQEVVGEVRVAGRTVLLSSHILAEAEALCDRVSIIRSGRIVERPLLADVGSMPGVHDAVVDDGNRQARFEVDSHHMGAVVSRLAEGGIVALTSTPPTLEELFMRHYGEEIDTGDASVPARGGMA